MTEGFSGEPLTRWKGPRNMELVEEVTYIGPDGKTWTVPQHAFLNGATIPRALWTWVGAPYAGKYRREVTKQIRLRGHRGTKAM